jgi:malto-oligosyltrehalose synthase
MAASTENPYFADVLRHGQGSRYAAYFDIDWSDHDGKVLLPVLGGPLDEVIAAGELKVEQDAPGEDPAVAYFEHRYPLDPAALAGVMDQPVAEVLSRQHYRLADWRVANRELNYRRFFDINELIGVRQDDPDVFAATHRLIRELAADPRVAGLRVDHVDGLRDPAGYLVELREMPGAGARPVIEVEKILERDELLPDWPVDGTTGYEFAVAVTGLFIDRDGADRLAAAAARATGDDRSFGERALVAKRDVLATLFERQLERVSRQMTELIGGDASASVAELTAQLSVYRTYRRVGETATAEDRRQLDAAAARTRDVLPDQSAAVNEVVAVLSGDLLPGTPAAEAVAAWQQLTSPVTAKGVEDTALYNPGRLLAAADVGGDPDRGAVAAAEFHAEMRERQEHHPLAISALSTHDSKRSHDVRCRLAVLSQIADVWERTVQELDDMMPSAAGGGVDVADRRYVYETLVGAWPLDGAVTADFVTRIDEHVVKAAREAKRHSSWTAPDTDYEELLRRFVDELLTDGDDRRRGAIGVVAGGIAVAGATNSLASVALRAAAPGVPDVYQGDDLWFFALVDPDNRRRLDVAAHDASLRSLPGVGSDAKLSEAAAAELLGNWRDGRIKQLVVRQSLQLRRRLSAFFESASYVPLQTTGRHRDALLAFARKTSDRTVVCVVPVRTQLLNDGQFPLGPGVWDDTAVELPAANVGFTDAVTGADIDSPAGAVPAGEIFRLLPVGVLESR